MKPIKQWLEELPEPYRTQALENCQEEFYLKKCTSSQHLALEHAFFWGKTPQGHNYWSDIWKKLQQETLVNKE